jgi:hypothetical protein
VGEQIEALKHHTDVSPLFRNRPLGQTLQSSLVRTIPNQPTIDVNSPRVDRFQVIDAPQQRAFA